MTIEALLISAEGWAKTQKRATNGSLRKRFDISEDVADEVYKILTSNREVTAEKCISGEKVVLPKGNKVIIGADRLAHHIKTGAIQTLAKDVEVKGYDRERLAEWIFDYMSVHLPMFDIETEFDLTDADIRQTIDDALEEIGFYGD